MFPFLLLAKDISLEVIACRIVAQRAATEVCSRLMHVGQLNRITHSV
jgi:hypothetical protein